MCWAGIHPQTELPISPWLTPTDLQGVAGYGGLCGPVTEQAGAITINRSLFGIWEIIWGTKKSSPHVKRGLSILECTDNPPQKEGIIIVKRKKIHNTLSMKGCYEI